MTHKDKTIDDLLIRFSGKTFSNNKQSKKYIESMLSIAYDKGYDKGDYECRQQIKEFIEE